MGEKILFREAWFLISSVPARNSCSKLAIKHKNKAWKLLRIKHEDSGVAPVSSLLTVNIFPTCFNFKEANVSRVHVKKKHFWRVHHALCCSILKFINKLHLNLYLHNPTGESVRNFCKGVYFRLWFWLKRFGSYVIIKELLKYHEYFSILVFEGSLSIEIAL